MASRQLKRLGRSPVWRGGAWGRLGMAALLGSLLLGLGGQQAQGQGVTAATITEILDSNQVYIQNQRARVNSVVQQRQRVSTQAARTALRFNTGAVARLAHNSNLVIGQCAQLNRGTMLVNGSLNGCSTSTIAGVRGTIYSLEVTETGQTVIRVFEGQVVVEHNPNPEPVEPLPTTTFDPADPALNPVVPTLDPVVPFINPPPVLEPPSPEPPLIEPDLPALDWTDPEFPEPFEFGPQGRAAYLLRAAGMARAKGDTEKEMIREGDIVNFTAADVLILAEGQRVTIDAEQEQAVIQTLSAEDFIALLDGPLIRDFAVDIPSLGNLRRTFEQRFPGVPWPSPWVPPVPSPPVRFPFPF